MHPLSIVLAPGVGIASKPAGHLGENHEVPRLAGRPICE